MPQRWSRWRNSRRSVTEWWTRLWRTNLISDQCLRDTTWRYDEPDSGNDDWNTNNLVVMYLYLFVCFRPVCLFHLCRRPPGANTVPCLTLRAALPLSGRPFDANLYVTVVLVLSTIFSCDCSFRPEGRPSAAAPRPPRVSPWRWRRWKWAWSCPWLRPLPTPLDGPAVRAAAESWRAINVLLIQGSSSLPLFPSADKGEIKCFSARANSHWFVLGFNVFLFQMDFWSCVFKLNKLNTLENYLKGCWRSFPTLRVLFLNHFYM